MSLANDNRESILIVDDVPANIAVLVDFLTGHGYTVLVAEDGESGLERADFAQPSLVLLDVTMPGIDGFETCLRMKKRPSTADIPIIFMTALSDTTDKVKGLRAGAVDYITKPIHQAEVLARIQTHLRLRRVEKELAESNESLEKRVAERAQELNRALSELEVLKNQLEAENVYFREEIKREHNFDEIIGAGQPILNALRQVQLVAATDATVLICGETGTGKELIARAIHSQSLRKHRPLVKVNCSAISAGLVESELFGHEKGAFTGALRQRIGRFELAHEATILLDEASELPLETQTKLLRVLQEQEFERVGSSRSVRVDVRVIAATNRDLQKEVREGRFRSDLFYRLNVFPITVPPLRDRLDDIPMLVEFFLKKFSKKLGKTVNSVSKEALSRMVAYPWPGNIRELQNVLERACITASGPVAEIPDFIIQSRDGTKTGVKSPGNFQTLEDVERKHIIEVLESTGWVVDGKSGAAIILDLHPNTLRSRMKKLSIRRPA